MTMTTVVVMTVAVGMMVEESKCAVTRALMR